MRPPPLRVGPAHLRRAAVLLVALGTLFGPAEAAAGEASEEAAQRLHDPRFRAGAPSDLRAKGPPRLSRRHIDAFLDLFETAFDAAVPTPAARELRAALEAEYASVDVKRRGTFLGYADTLAALRCRARCCDWCFVHAGLRSFRAGIDRRLRTQPKAPANRILAQVLARRHEFVWRGEPVLKGLAVDAYLEMAVFVTSLARNDPVRLSAGQKKELRASIGRALQSCDVRTRECLAASHRLWLRVKARWDRSRDEWRWCLRWEALKLHARLVRRPGSPAAHASAGVGHKYAGMKHTAYARAASKVAAAGSAADAVGLLARHPRALREAVCCGLALCRKAPPFPFQYR